MLTLLGSLLGFLSSGIPKVFEYLDKKEDNSLKLQIIQAQIEAARQNQAFDLQVFNAKKEYSEQELLVKHDEEMKDNLLSSSVRPVITYLFFFIFAAVKVSMIHHALSTGSDFYNAMQMTWDEETQSIFAAIISFWFGSRAMQKLKK